MWPSERQKQKKTERERERWNLGTQEQNCLARVASNKAFVRADRENREENLWDVDNVEGRRGGLKKTDE